METKEEEYSYEKEDMQREKRKFEDYKGELYNIELIEEEKRKKRKTGISIETPEEKKERICKQARIEPHFYDFIMKGSEEYEKIIFEKEFVEELVKKKYTVKEYESLDDQYYPLENINFVNILKNTCTKIKTTYFNSNNPKFISNKRFSDFLDSVEEIKKKLTTFSDFLDVKFKDVLEKDKDNFLLKKKENKEEWFKIQKEYLNKRVEEYDQYVNDYVFDFIQDLFKISNCYEKLKSFFKYRG